MPNETMTAADAKMLETQIIQNREEINRLKQELEQLRNMLGLSETDEFEAQLNKEEVYEFGTLGSGLIKGKINWMNTYLISITPFEEEAHDEILVFKQALAYIRKPEEKSSPPRGMYI